MRGSGDLFDDVYCTVKSYASKGTLLTRTEIEALAEAKDLEDLAGRLKGTIYSDSILRISKPYTPERFEMAFREHLASMHDGLIRVTPKSELLVSYYQKYVVWNLKTVIKGKALEMSFDEIVQHVNLHAEELVGRRDLVVKALSAKDLDEVTNLLMKTEFGEEIKSSVGVYRDKKEIQVFDAYLDRAFFKSLLSSYEKLVAKGRGGSYARGARGLVAIDIDSYNILSILRAKLWNLSTSQIKDLMIEPTFDVRPGTLKAMIRAGSINEAVKDLEITPYRSIIPSGVSEEETILKIEEKFDALICAEALRAFLWQVYGVGVVLAIIKLKELEIRNLAAVAIGVEQRMGHQRIMSGLVGLA